MNIEGQPIAENAETTLAPASTPVASPSRICPECSGVFTIPSKGPGGHKRFCASLCRQAWANREKAEGAVLATYVKIWRQNRGSGPLGKLAFARLCEAADVLNENDTKAKRHRLNANGPLEPFIRDVLAEPYLDRRRR